jgi:hypothetical protein
MSESTWPSYRESPLPKLHIIDTNSATETKSSGDQNFQLENAEEETCLRSKRLSF